MKTVDFRYVLHDKNGKEIKDLKTVVSCNVDYGAFTDLLSTARIVLEEDKEIDYDNDRIAPKLILDGVEHSLGMFLISSPGREFSGNVAAGTRPKPMRDLACYSLLRLLKDDKIEDRLYIPKGTNVLAEVTRQLAGQEKIIPIETGVTKSDKEFEIGTERLQIINDLLKIVNYTKLRVDHLGRFVASPYIPPEKRTPNITYDQRRGDCTILATDSVTDSTDLFDVANVFVAYTNSSDIIPPLRSVYENNNPSNKLSTVYRRRVVRVEAVSDIANQETLDAYCKRLASEATQVYSYAKFSTALNPAHGYHDCIRLVAHDLDDNYLETNWSMDLSLNGKMTHEARRLMKL